jgi:CRP-like cAMP-binding protein
MRQIETIMVGKQLITKYEALIMGTFLFKDTDAAVMHKMLGQDGARIEQYESGAMIYDPGKYEKCLGIILEGSAKVTKVRGGHGVLAISTLRKGDMFGAVTLFNAFDKYVTQITATGRCRALILSESLLRTAFRDEFKLTENYIEYLTGRIYFLNRKIESFTGASAVAKLRMYIMDRTDDQGQVKLELSMTTLAQSLGVGRASLYRALDELIENGEIERDGKRIILKDI